MPTGIACQSRSRKSVDSYELLRCESFRLVEDKIMKVRIRDLLKARKDDLRKASPKSRDRARHRVHVLEKVMQIKRENRAA